VITQMMKSTISPRPAAGLVGRLRRLFPRDPDFSVYRAIFPFMSGPQFWRAENRCVRRHYAAAYAIAR
ncbi:MAG: hypothetical protein KDJ90_18010, partial [Nitratireductor sp.]|nr:hypothetical protein [Nitratireductor sp.]